MTPEEHNTWIDRSTGLAVFFLILFSGVSIVLFGRFDISGVFLAGGIGITPIRSILKTLAARQNQPGKTILHHERDATGVRTYDRHPGSHCFQHHRWHWVTARRNTHDIRRLIKQTKRLPGYSTNKFGLAT